MTLLHKMIRKRKQLLYNKITEEEQQVNRTIGVEDWNRVTYLTNQKKGLVDGITSNDLELCNLFARMNYCMSSLGEECFVSLLHNPAFHKEELQKREKVISYYEKKDDERIYVKSLFSKIGKPKYVSLFEYIDILCEASCPNIRKHYICLFDILLGIILMQFAGRIGLAFFLVSIVYNVVTYFMDKAFYDSYTYPMSFIEEMVRFYYKVPKELAGSLDLMEKVQSTNTKELKKLFRFSRVVYSKEFMGGNIGELFMDNIRMLTHMDIIYFHYQMKSLGDKKSKLMEWMKELGYFESLVSAASFRKTLDYYCVPEFSARENELTMTELYHPLIENPVANSMKMTNSVLLTGSNASGKSTYLKTVAINLIMAQTICTCTAKAFVSSFYHVVSSMALRDSLDQNESYYITEIKALKRMMDMENGTPVFCLIDEILRGTNTVERIASAAHILSFFKENGKLCMAATHDIELTYLLEGKYDNYHFCEICQDQEVRFDYKLKVGRCENKNAIKLLKVLGIDKKVIEGAEKTAGYFEQTSRWKMDF